MSKQSESKAESKAEFKAGTDVEEVPECADCGKPFGDRPAYQSSAHPGLVCEEHRRAGMKPVSNDARHLAEVFTREGLAKLDAALESQPWARELREAALNWIEHHTERKLATRKLLETP